MTDLLNSRYHLVEILGQGSMGVVWRAQDTLLDREVAIKELRPVEGVDPEEARDRFLVEARAAAKLAHPNIVAVHDVFSDGDRVLITMELVAGPTLAEVVSGSGPQRAEVVRAVMAQVAQALAGAHGAGVVHRDLKPENIFWTPQGRAVVADFGLARIGAGRGTMEGTVMGTPGYMAPEQVRGMVVGPAADVFAWGAVAYELATGRAPFGEASATDPSALAYRIVHQDPPALELPEDPALAALIDRAMAKEPDDRPADGAALALGLLTQPSASETRLGAIGMPNERPSGPPLAPAPQKAASQPATPAGMPIVPVAVDGRQSGPSSAGGLAIESLPPVHQRESGGPGVVATSASLHPDERPSSSLPGPLTGATSARPRRTLLKRPKSEPGAVAPTARSGRNVPAGVLLALPALVFIYMMVVVAAGGGAPKNSGTIEPGEVTLNGIDPATAAEVLLDFHQPLVVAGTAEPDTIKRVRIEFSALGIPLGSGNIDGLQHADGSYQAALNAADSRFLVGGKVTTKLILYGRADSQSGISESRSRTFAASSVQPSLRTVPAAIAAILVLFVLAYLRSSIYWMIYGDRRSFETSNLVIGGVFAGFTFVIVAWLLGAPEPDERVLVTCIALGAGFGAAVAVASYGAARRRDSRLMAATRG